MRIGLRVRALGGCVLLGSGFLTHDHHPVNVGLGWAGPRPSQASLALRASTLVPRRVLSRFVKESQREQEGISHRAYATAFARCLTRNLGMAPRCWVGTRRLASAIVSG